MVAGRQGRRPGLVLAHPSSGERIARDGSGHGRGHLSQSSCAITPGSCWSSRAHTLSGGLPRAPVSSGAAPHCPAQGQDAALAPGVTIRSLPPPPNTIGDPAPPPRATPRRVPPCFRAGARREGGRKMPPKLHPSHYPRQVLAESRPRRCRRLGGSGVPERCPVSPWIHEGWPRHSRCPLPTFAEGLGGSSPYSSPQGGQNPLQLLPSP